MSTLGPEVLLDPSIFASPVVENLSLRDSENPEGAGLDFRLGEVYKVVGSAYLGISERKIAEIELIAKYDETNKEKQIFVINPGDVYMVKTIEKVNMPANLTAGVTLRRTGYSAGLVLSSGNVSPGYRGELAFTIWNPTQLDFEVELGSRLFFVKFDEVIGATQYRGQWQNNNMHRSGEETQI